MPIRTGVIGVAFLPALVTAFQMAAQRRGAAQFYGAQYAFLPRRQRGGVRVAKLLAMRTHNIGDFECRPHREAGDLLGKINCGIGQQIQRARGGAHGAGSQVKVACRGGQTAVTEEQLNFTQVGPGLQ
jgi:hypothetical protein